MDLYGRPIFHFLVTSFYKIFIKRKFFTPVKWFIISILCISKIRSYTVYVAALLIPAFYHRPPSFLLFFLYCMITFFRGGAPILFLALTIKPSGAVIKNEVAVFYNRRTLSAFRKKDTPFLSCGCFCTNY